MKLVFADDAEGGRATPVRDRKELASLAEKIRARFKACVMPCSNMEDDGEIAIAVTSLAHSEEALGRQLDSIADFCEECGFGRVAAEHTLMDHIDAISEDGDDDDHDDEDESH